MNKEDLIYDIVCEIRDQNNKRFEQVEKDIKDLYKFKNTLLGIGLVVSAVFGFIIDNIKNFFRV